MSGWTSVGFEDACTDVSSGNNKILRSEFAATGQFPIVDQGEEEIAGFTDNPELLFQGPTPVIVFGDHTRRFKFVDHPFAIGADGVKVLAPTDGIDPRYLFQYLRSVDVPSAGYSRHYKFLRRLDVPLPSLDEQRRIARVLDAAEALRAKRREALSMANRLTMSLFASAFGDVTRPSAPATTTPLGDMLSRASVFTDGDWVESKDQDHSGSVRLVQLADIGEGAFLDRSSRFLTTATAQRLRCTYLKGGDVLVARMPDPLGRACIFPGSSRPCVTVVDVCIIRLGPAGPDPVWLAACLNSWPVRDEIGRRATGTTRERISRGNLAKILIREPPYEDQRAFSGQVEKVGWVAAQSAASLAHLDALFASLQDRAFSGKL